LSWIARERLRLSTSQKLRRIEKAQAEVERPCAACNAATAYCRLQAPRAMFARMNTDTARPTPGALLSPGVLYPPKKHARQRNQLPIRASIDVYNDAGQREHWVILSHQPATLATIKPTARQSHRRRRENTTKPKHHTTTHTTCKVKVGPRAAPPRFRFPTPLKLRRTKKHQPASPRGTTALRPPRGRPVDRHCSPPKIASTAPLVSPAKNHYPIQSHYCPGGGRGWKFILFLP
jgi:hypothetical protein